MMSDTMSVEQHWRAALRLAACMAEYASRRGEPLHKQFDAMIQCAEALRKHLEGIAASKQWGYRLPRRWREEAPATKPREPTEEAGTPSCPRG